MKTNSNIYIQKRLQKILENFVKINIDGKKQVYITKRTYNKILSGRLDTYAKIELISKNIEIEEINLLINKTAHQ